MTTRDSASQPKVDCAQEGKTAFYEGLQDRELERRQQLTKAMSWLRPVDRWRKQRAIARIDNLLVGIGATLEESRIADSLVAEAHLAAAQAQESVQETIQPIILHYDAAAETPVAVVENR